MRIGIDATGMLIRVRTGIQRYTTSLISAMVTLLPSYPDLKLSLYFHTGNRDADSAALHEIRSLSPQISVRTWAWARGYRMALSAFAAADRLDCLHLPEPNPLRLQLCPSLITVHDLCWAKLPEDLVYGERHVNMPAAQSAITQAAAFISVSESTRLDLIDIYGVKPEQVHVVYEGADAHYRPSLENSCDIREKYGLGRYLLCVSTLQKRKNLVRLIEAYAQLLRQYDLPQQLVFAGSKGWGHEEIFQSVNALGLANRVIFLDYVPDADLPGLYTGTDLFVYPSLYEGFGLPVLEAMACGAPIAVANRSSLPEVAGDAGVYFDPLVVTEIADAIYRVLSNPNFRDELRNRSLQRAKCFSWLEAAQQTIAVYQRFTQRPPYAP